jgi:hypothetical protein
MRRRFQNSLRREALVGIALAALAHAGYANATSTVGTAGAANTRSTSTPPGGALRVIEIGAQVVENEKIDTSGSGSVQLLFIDKTTLNIGPHSSVVIDKFVFNPMTTEGELAITLSKGALRLVGGQATHTGGATITTPVAAIGVRGGIVSVNHEATHGTRAVLGFGTFTMTSRCLGKAGCESHSVTVTRPGFMVQTAAAGDTPSDPVKASASLIDQSNVQLTSRPGQTGGSNAVPTDQLAAVYNVGTVNSPAATTVIVNQGQGRGGASPSVYQATQTAAQGEQSTAANVTAQNNAPANTTPPSTALTPPTVSSSQTPPVSSSPPAPAPPPPTSYSLLTLGPYSTNLGASPMPYLTASFVVSGGATISTVSPILGYARGGLNADGTIDTASRQLQAGLSISGQGAAQTSTFFVMTSEIANAPNIGYTAAGGIEATARLGSNQNASVAYGAVGSATSSSGPNSVPTNANGVPIGPYSLTSNAINLDNGVITPVSESQYISSSVNYTFNPVNTAAPTSLAINHPNLTLQGYVGGLMQTASSVNGVYGAPYVITNATGQPGDVSIFLPGTSSEMGAVFNVVGSNVPANGVTSAQFNFGSYNPSDPNNTAGLNGAEGAYINRTNFGAREALVFDNGANVPTSTENGSTLGQGNIGQILVTAGTVGANSASFLSSISSTSVQPCACEYTQWGFWSANSTRAGATTYYDASNLMLWVAGVPTTAGSIPQTGTATYTGHAIANISNNGAQYISAGTFSNTVNFGARTGSVSIGGLDGTNYAGTVNLTPSSTLFAGTLSGSTGARAAALNGSFFQGGPTNTTPGYGEMGGSINIAGTNYLGSGIFAARKP